MLTFKQFYYILEDASTDQAIVQIQAALGQIDTQINQRTQPLLNQKQQLQRRLSPLLKKKQDDDKKLAAQNTQQQSIQQPQLGQQIGVNTPGSYSTPTPSR